LPRFERPHLLAAAARWTPWAQGEGQSRITSASTIYLLNQNYTHGQQVSKAAKEYLARKRPDISWQTPPPAKVCQSAKCTSMT
jgi:hypothetical protein